MQSRATAIALLCAASWNPPPHASCLSPRRTNKWLRRVAEEASEHPNGSPTAAPIHYLSSHFRSRPGGRRRNRPENKASEVEEDGSFIADQNNQTRPEEIGAEEQGDDSPPPSPFPVLRPAGEEADPLTHIRGGDHNNDANDYVDVGSDEDVASSGPDMNALNWTLPSFNRAGGSYGNCGELRSDLIEAASYVADDAIMWNYERENNLMSGPIPMNAKLARTGASAGIESGGGSLDGMDSFDTNTQEEVVDESDVVKSDGEIVCMAYGSEVRGTTRIIDESRLLVSDVSACFSNT